MMILVTGGSGSGKSAFAEECFVRRMNAIAEAAGTDSDHVASVNDSTNESINESINESTHDSTIENTTGNPPRIYLATMQVYGAEGRQKVERHRRLREGKGFVTMEQTSNLASRIAEIPENAGVLLECMSNLTANEMFTEHGIAGEAETVERITADVLAIAQKAALLVIVTNNVFDDGVAYDESTMAYLRALGAINRRLAQQAEEVYECVAGIPVRLL